MQLHVKRRHHHGINRSVNVADRLRARRVGICSGHWKLHFCVEGTNVRNGAPSTSASCHPPDFQDKVILPLIWVSEKGGKSKYITRVLAWTAKLLLRCFTTILSVAKFGGTCVNKLLIISLFRTILVHLSLTSWEMVYKVLRYFQLFITPRKRFLFKTHFCFTSSYSPYLYLLFLSRR